MYESETLVRDMMRRVVGFVYDKGNVSSPVAVVDQISAVWFLYHYWTEPTGNVDRVDDFIRFIEGDKETKAEIRRMIHQSNEIVPIQIVDAMAEAIHAMNAHFVRQLMRLLDELIGKSRRLNNMNYSIKHLQVRAFEILLEELDYDKNPDLAPTPDDLVQLMVGIASQEIASNHSNIRVFDPCCGTGRLLVAAHREIIALEPQREVEIYGTDISSPMIRICYMNLLLHGVEKIELYPADALRDDALPNFKFQLILSHLPFSSSPLSFPVDAIPERVSGQDSEILFLEIIERHLANHSVAAVLMTDSILRTTRLNEYRNKLIREHVISGGVELPIGALPAYKRTEAAIIFLGNIRKQADVAVFTRYDPQSFDYEEYRSIWSQRSSLWDREQGEHYVPGTESLFLLVPFSRIRRAKLSPNYYLSQTIHTEKRRDYSENKGRILDQIKRSTRAWKRATTQEKRAKLEQTQSYEVSAKRLGISGREWNLLAQQLVIEGQVDTELTHAGRVLYRYRQQHEPSNREAIYAIESRLREYLSADQFELFEIFRNQIRPMAIQQALHLLEEEKRNQGDLRRPFGMMEAEQTITLMQKMGIMEPIFHAYLPEGSELDSELEELSIQTFVLWRVVDGGGEKL